MYIEFYDFYIGFYYLSYILVYVIYFNFFFVVGFFDDFLDVDVRYMDVFRGDFFNFYNFFYFSDRDAVRFIYGRVEVTGSFFVNIVLKII